MKKTLALTLLAVLGLSACDRDKTTQADGINSLGSDFVRAFQQDRNDEPISLEGVTINQFPEREPFSV